MTKIPIGRVAGLSFYNAGAQAPSELGPTWLESESWAYPAGGFTRRAYVELRLNMCNPLDLPYGRRYLVKCSIPDTYFSIPARLIYRGKTIRGYVSVNHCDVPRYTFTPEGQ